MAPTLTKSMLFSLQRVFLLYGRRILDQSFVPLKATRNLTAHRTSTDCVLYETESVRRLISKRQFGVSPSTDKKIMRTVSMVGRNPTRRPWRPSRGRGFGRPRAWSRPHRTTLIRGSDAARLGGWLNADARRPSRWANRSLYARRSRPKYPAVPLGSAPARDRPRQAHNGPRG